MPDSKILEPQPETFTLEVQSPGRADALILAHLKARFGEGISRSRIKDLMSEGLLTVDGRKLTASHALSPGAHRITLLDPAILRPAQAAASTRGSFLTVVYQDPDLLVLNKSFGVPSLPLDPKETETAVGSALAWDPGLHGVGKGGLEPGLLHRLDTGTSGLLAFARTPQAYERLKAQWKQGSVRKIYRALAPRLAQVPGTLRLSLGHDAQRSKKMRVVTEGQRPSALRGKPLPTVTHLVLLGPTQAAGHPVADYQIEIETGVMHQIRCTLAHIGAPILGDPIYGGPPAERLWLHAWRLALPLPHGGELWIESALPPGWPSA